MAYKIVLFLGAGGNVGAASLAKFKEKGYKVAAVSRNPVDAVRVSSDLVLSADLSDPFCVKGIFEKVEKELGVPSVVVYNCMFPYPFTASAFGVTRYCCQ